MAGAEALTADGDETTARRDLRAARAVFERLGGEVVNADSMQLYRGMDIGTAKPSAEERAAVPHHLIDIADRDVLVVAGPTQALLERTGTLIVDVADGASYLITSEWSDEEAFKSFISSQAFRAVSRSLIGRSFSASARMASLTTAFSSYSLSSAAFASSAAPSTLPPAPRGSKPAAAASRAAAGARDLLPGGRVAALIG